MRQLHIMTVHSPPHLIAGDAIVATLVLFFSTSAGPECIAPFPSACQRYVSLNLRGGRGGMPGGGAQSNDGVGGRRDKPEQPKGRRARHQPWRISDYEERRQARVRRARAAIPDGGGVGVRVPCGDDGCDVLRRGGQTRRQPLI